MLSKCPLSSEYRVEALHVIWFLLSSSFYDSPFWHKFPSKQCQNTVKKLPIPSGSKGRKMCPWQFGEFGHGKEAWPGVPSALELILRPVAEHSSGKIVQTSNLGGGHSGPFSRVPREWALRAERVASVFSHKVIS